MHVGEAINLAVWVIRTNKLRAFFTVLGTVVGVTFLIAVVTLISGMDGYVREDLAGKVYGFNTVMVRRVPSVEMDMGADARRALARRPLLTLEDAEWLEGEISTAGVLAVSVEGSGKIAGPGRRAMENARIVGSSATFFRIRDMVVDYGRVFSEQEAERGVPVVVIGKDVADKLFNGRNPLEQSIRIQRFPYRVVGVLEKQAPLFGASMDNVVIAPIRSRVSSAVGTPGVVGEIMYKVPHADLLGPAIAELQELMRIRHGLRAEQLNDFS
ncbi:MAG TPA: ABC transporter permease, partial [Longimicrobiaceae bacterium]|nr:ABC transporter permease [Longimicrobiaceae bacterium]